MPMDRYRLIGQEDDASQDEGDSSLVGVNEWDSPENIPPGQVQTAVNIDCTTQDAVTRGGFVAIPQSVALPFGITWSSQVSAADKNWRGIAYGNGTFVAVANNGGSSDIMTSQDGVSWASRTSGQTNQWTGVCYGNGLFVAVAWSGTGNRVMTSPDGVTWTSRTSAANLLWQDVAYGNGLFVAVASDSGTSGVMTSPDGITWTSRTTPNGGWSGIIYGSDQFVAVGQGVGVFKVMTSPDGVTWTGQNAAAANQWTAVAYGNSIYVAVAISGTGNRVMTSPDGVTWTAYAASADNDWNDVVFGNGVFVAVSSTGTGTRAMSSRTGSSWTQDTSAADNNWQSVTFGVTSFVAVSTSGTGNRVMTSSVKTVFGSGTYSDPNDAGSIFTMLAGSSSVGFYSFGRSSRTVAYATGETVSEQSTIVQCNNLVYLFRGSSQTPLYWDGNWGSTFQLVPATTAGAGFSSIADSNQATYYQNRLWVINGKDLVDASDVLDFTTYDDTANAFNLNTGSSDFLVTTYPFGTNTLLVFKNRSIIALQNVEGALSDVTATEITRQVGAIGINAVVSVGPDVVYMSDRNINLITLTDTNNSLQHKTLPLSRNIQKIFNRVNWNYAYKVSMGYFDNKLFVALPLDNSTTCNAVVVYNFVTENWFGEWNFDSSLGISIQNFVVANYLGLQRLHAVTEDGRIFVVGEGPQDISGTNVVEISSALTTRAYSFGNQNHVPRRLYFDASSWRPNISVTAYSEGVSESSEELTDQTFARSESWIFNDSTYSLTNASDDYNRAGRKDYAGYAGDSIQPQSGFTPQAEQEYRFPIITRRKGRLSWLKIENTQGLLRVMSVGFEARSGNRGNFVQVL